MEAPGGRPERIGVYPVEKVLGRGGMGVVYLARDPRLEREVALKVLSEDYTGDAELMNRFDREAKILASLSHPNIATIFGLEEAEDGTRFLVLELIRGETLARRLRRGALPVPDALRICLQIAEGVEAAHRRGVIHRDLKPDNVMLTEGDRVKLMDFGLAKHEMPRSRPVRGDVSTVLASWTATEPGRVMGTPGYISPEQIRGQPLDKRTDIFAFGCVLFECLTGQRAFRGETPVDIFASILTGDPDWPALPDDLPESIETLIVGCLEKDAGRRVREIEIARRELETALETVAVPGRTKRRRRVRVPGNLPVEFTSFVGREQELDELRGILGAHPVLTLTGVGGCGKTRLSLKLAGRERTGYPDGVWWVELAPTQDPGRVPNAVAAALGLKEELGRDLMETMGDHLVDRRVLLVLDNCEHVLGAVRDLVVLLIDRCPDLVVLATSREALGIPGEQVFLVPPLAVPDPEPAADPDRMAGFESVRLFEERARAGVPEFELSPENAGVVGEICRELDGIPLAIELAAARVKLLSPGQILDKLKDRFRLLTGGSRKAFPHHQTLRAAIDWSYEQLEAEERGLLDALSVFAGGLTLDGAQAVAGEGLDEYEVLDRVTQLVDRSLLVAEKAEDGATRFRMLETIRQYGREKLQAGGDEEPVLDRYVDFYLELAERSEEGLSGPEQAIWLRDLGVEHANLLGAIDVSGEVPDGAVKGLRIAGSMWRFWYLNGYYGYGWNALTGVLGREGAMAPTEARARALNGAGNMALVHSDYAAARKLYQEALAIRRGMNDEPGVARLLNNLGNLAWYEGSFSDARLLYEESLDIKRRLGDKPGIAATLDNLGSILLNLNDLEAARRLHEESLDLHRELGTRSAQAISLHNLGIVSRYLGDYTRARALHEESLEIERETGNKLSTMPPLFNLAAVTTRAGDHGSAAPYLSASFELVLETGEKRFGAYSLEAAGELAEAVGDLGQAARFFAAADALRGAIGSPRSPAEEADCRTVVERVRDGLGEEAGRHWQEGGALSFEGAVEEALVWLRRFDSGDPPESLFRPTEPSV